MLYPQLHACGSSATRRPNIHPSLLNHHSGGVFTAGGGGLSSPGLLVRIARTEILSRAVTSVAQYGVPVLRNYYIWGIAMAIDCRVRSRGWNLPFLPMNFATLLNKLIQIEAAAAAQDFATVRALTLEAEEMVLHLEREIIEALREKAHKDAARFRHAAALPPF